MKIVLAFGVLALCFALARADESTTEVGTTLGASQAPSSTFAPSASAPASSSSQEPTVLIGFTTEAPPISMESQPLATTASSDDTSMPTMIMMNVGATEANDATTAPLEPYIRERGDNIFLFVPTRMTFSQADAYCVGLSKGNTYSNYTSYLASIHSPRENKAVAKWAYHMRPTSYMWIGTKRISSNSKPFPLRFGNVDGSAFDIAAKYSTPGSRVGGGRCASKRECLFMDYQPSETRLGHQDCVAMKIGGEEYSRWNDIPCGRRLPFVCKITLKSGLNTF